MASLGDLVVTVGAQIGGFTDAMTQVSNTLQGLGDTATASLEHFDGIIDGLGEIAAAAGIATGAFEIAKEALESFSKAQDVQTSFELLTGSADEAKIAFEGLKETAVQLAIPFDELVSVSQKLAPQFGVGTQALKDVTTAAADAAAATGRSFDTIADGLDRIAITGQVSTRQMVQFGVSMSDIAAAMGVSVDQAITLLKKGGQDAQADVDAVVTAIENKFGGAAQAIGQNLSGQLTNLKNELGFLSEELGSALAPLASDLIAALKDVEPAIKSIIDDGIKPFVAEVQSLFAEIKDGAASIGDTLSGGDTLAGGQASGWIATQIDGIKSLVSEYSTLDGQIKDLAVSIAAIGEQTGFLPMLQASSDASHSLLGEIISLKGAFDLLFPEFQQLTDLLQVLNFALDSYQGKVSAMKDGHDALTKAMQATTAAADPWNTEAMKIAESQLAADNAARKHAAGLDILSQAFKDLGVKIPPSEAELNKLATALETIKAAYDAGKIPLSEYSAAVDDFTKKMKSLYGAFVPQGPADDIGNLLKTAGISDSTAALDKLTQSVSTFHAAAGQIGDLTTDGDTLAGLGDKFKDLGAYVEGSITQASALDQAFYDGRVPVADYAAEIVKLNQAYMDLADPIKQATQAFQIAGQEFDNGETSIQTVSDKLVSLTSILPGVQDGILKQGAAIAGLNVSMDSITQTVPNVAQILKSFGVETADDVTAHIKLFQDQLNQANAAMALGVPGAALAAQLALQGLRQEQEKFSQVALDDAKLGIPNLVSLQQRLADATTAYQDLANHGLLNATTSLEGMITQQKLAIEIATQQGQDTTQLRVNLDQMTNSLKLQTTASYDLAKQLGQTFGSDLSNALSTVIFQTGSISDAFKKIGEDIVSTVLDTIIKQAITPLATSLASLVSGPITDLSKSLGGILTQFTQIGKSASAISSGGGVSIPGLGGGGVTGSGEGGVEGAVNSGDFVAGSDLSGEAEGAASSGASGATSAVTSTLASTVSAITGVVSAITGIVGIFQQAHQQDTLTSIESNTRQDALYNKSTLDWIQDIQNFNYNSLFPEVAGINSMLMDFINGQGPLGSALASFATPKTDYSEYNSDTFGSISSTLDNILLQLQGQVHDDMATIEGKLDTLNQSVVQNGSSAGTGTFAVNGVTQTVTKVGQPIQMVSNQPSTAPTYQDLVNGAIGAAPWKSFTDSMSLQTEMLTATLTDWFGTINTSISTSNSWLSAITTDLLSGFNAVVAPRLDQMIQLMRNNIPAINVTIQGNVIGNDDFAKEVADTIAATIRQQGAYA